MDFLIVCVIQDSSMLDLTTLPSDTDKLKAIIGIQIQEYRQAIQDFKSQIRSKDTELQERDRQIVF